MKYSVHYEKDEIFWNNDLISKSKNIIMILKVTKWTTKAVHYKSSFQELANSGTDSGTENYNIIFSLKGNGSILSDLNLI